VQKVFGTSAELQLMTLDPSLEQLLHKSLQGSGGLGVEPNLAERVQRAVSESAQHQELTGEPAVLVVSPELRAPLGRWLRPVVRGLHVLAYTEIPDNRQLRVVATIGAQNGLESPVRAAG
jgi:flagellar biosynthesis protein FlhA